ncbi:MAG: RimK family protein [Kiloniellales bacterium]
MPQHIVVVDREKDFKWPDAGYRVVAARDYITQPEIAANRVRIINLCRDFSYLAIGYYCSLLAEARGQKVIPSVEVLLELNWKRLYKSAVPELEELFNKALAPGEEGEFKTLHFFFGRSQDERLKDVARRLFELFRCPILGVDLRYRRGWQVRNLGTVTLRDLPPELDEAFLDGLGRYTKAQWREPTRRAAAKYTIAMLYDPEEKLPPSDKRALDKFIEAGRALGASVELITRRDFGKLAEYDALFIRETTQLDHHTYRFAKRAVAEGMPVIDDPLSILKCTNKVYLAELLRANKIATPRTLILDRRALLAAGLNMHFPLVLKVPDGSFSRGVFKAKDEAELKAFAEKIFIDSDVLLAQEFMYTDFDWRVGTLNGEPLYVSKYFMSKGHWQIVKHHGSGRFSEGGYASVALAEAPAAVVDVAVRAARLIGKGLYGVDVKENKDGVFVIEVNDNPSIESGVEDGELKEQLYQRIIGELIRRIESR